MRRAALLAVIVMLAVPCWAVELLEELLADGVTDYLHKPFKPEQIRDLLLRTVGV